MAFVGRRRDRPSLAEITGVRLGENIEPRLVSSTSRTGRVIYQDDIEAYTSALTEKWVEISGKIALDTTNPFRGKVCAKLTTGAVAGDNAEMDKFLGALPLGRVGLEFWWMSKAGIDNFRYLDIAINHWDGAYYRAVEVLWIGKLTTVQKKWQYLSSGLYFVDIPNGAYDPYIESTFPKWHHLKLTADMLAEKYVVLICDNKVYPLSTFAIPKAEDTSPPCMSIILRVYTETNTAIDTFFDDIIITDQEP